MKIETIQKTEKIPELIDFELEAPKLFTIDDDVKNKQNIEFFDVTFDKVPVKFRITSHVFLKDTTNDLNSVSIELGVLSKNKFYLASIDLVITKNSNGTYRAATDVTNKNRKMKGLGRTLWEISIKLIQKLTDKFNASIVHEVSREPNDGLDVEKWNTLFFPLLEKYGYTPKVDNKWKKIYTPTKNKSTL